jgi:nucleotide-binding universal stress UspA family protein
MSLWFSATAAAPELAVAWDLTATETAWLTIAVQLGFVAGAFLSAILTLFDVLQPRYLFAGSAVFGAVATVMIASLVDSAFPAILLRFLTGVALAGVYPPGMKLMAGWFRRGRGLAIGVLVGALTVGSALPPLLRGLGCHLLRAGKIDDKADWFLQETAEKLRNAGYALTAQAIPGDPEHVISEAIEREGIQLLVMGAYGHSPIRYLVLGSTTTKMIMKANVPLLVVR